jgi:hypothetical protein
MTKYYKATFEDGTVIRRATASRTYSHAWLVRNIANDRRRDIHGFSRTPELARQTGGYRNYDVSMVAEAIEITAAEYRRLG